MRHLHKHKSLAGCPEARSIALKKTIEDMIKQKCNRKIIKMYKQQLKDLEQKNE